MTSQQELPALRLKTRDSVVGRGPSTKRAADAYFRFSAAAQLALRKRASGGGEEQDESEKEGEGDAAAELEGLYNAFLLELSRLERVTTRLASVRGACQRQMQNYGEAEASILGDIEAAQRDISDLKIRLRDARAERQHKEEYEAAAAVVNGGFWGLGVWGAGGSCSTLHAPRARPRLPAHGLGSHRTSSLHRCAPGSRVSPADHPSRQQQRQRMLELERELQEIEREGAIREAQLERRNEQFQLLLQSIMQLKAELGMGGKNKGGKGGKGSSGGRGVKGDDEEKKSKDTGVAAAAASAAAAAARDGAEPLASMLPFRRDAMQVDG